MKEQYERFCKIAYVAGNCERCPISEECYDFNESLTPEEDATAPHCEEILFDYIMTGKTPSK